MGSMNSSCDCLRLSWWVWEKLSGIGLGSRSERKWGVGWVEERDQVLLWQWQGD